MTDENECLDPGQMFYSNANNLNSSGFRRYNQLIQPVLQKRHNCVHGQGFAVLLRSALMHDRDNICAAVENRFDCSKKLPLFIAQFKSE
jgi:hypothetical protein